VVKILLGREEVNPDNPENYGRTPLEDAAQNGSLGNPGLVLRTRNCRRSYGSPAWVYWYLEETGKLAGEDVAELQQPEVVVR